jgi:hypothetical protein
MVIVLPAFSQSCDTLHTLSCYRLIRSNSGQSRQRGTHSCYVGKTTKHQQALYLEHKRAEQLDQLARETRIPKAVLLREAVDDLLVKHKALKPSDLKR